VTIMPTMARLVRQLLVLILTAFLSLGPSWSTAQANGMPGKMTVAMDSVAGSHGRCHKCPMTGDEHTKAFLCGALCGMAAQAVAPQVASVWFTQARPMIPALEQPLRGRTLPPDPYPPRPSRAV
jgi:hypothetical protein